MTSFTTRLAHGHAVASAATRPLLTQPDVFVRTRFAVLEISEAVTLSARMAIQLRTAQIRCSLGDMEFAQRELGKMLAQASELNRVVGEQLAKERAGR